MNRDETKKAIEIMQAYVDGAEVQFRSNQYVSEDEAPSWAECAHKYWAWGAMDYRIKPKPREFEIALDADGKIAGSLGPYRSPGEVIKVREVFE